MVDVHGIKSHPAAIEPWLFPTGSGSTSPEHTLSVCSPGSSAELASESLQQPILTPETLLLCKFLQAYDTAVCQEMEVKTVVRLGKWLENTERPEEKAEMSLERHVRTAGSTADSCS